MASPVFDVEVRAFSRSTGQRLPLNPKLVLAGVTWSYVERGGAEMATVPIRVPFEQVPVSNGDILEIWAQNDGSTVPRWRGACNVTERQLKTSETCLITAYGRMEDMAHSVINEVLVHANSVANGSATPGNDLAFYAHDIFAAYVARCAQSTASYQPWLNFVPDIQTTGINLVTLDGTLATARAAMDALVDQAGANVVWGWDIDPTTGYDRFYLRPRNQSVGRQFFIGVGVEDVTAPTELQALTNAVWVKGGPATYPNLITNPSFEVPTVPSSESGNLLQDGSFEASGASGSFIDGWNGVSGATLAHHDPSNNWNFGAHTGQYCVTLGYVNAEVWQEVPVTVGTQYLASVYAARAQASFANTGQLIIEGRNASGTVVAGQTFTAPIKPPSTAWTGGGPSTILSGDAIQQLVTFTDSTVAKARVRVVATNAGTAIQELLIDDVVLSTLDAVGSFGWGTHVQNVGSAANSVASINWACRSARWDGAYGVELQTVANSSNKVYIAPLPEPGTKGGAEFGQGGYQLKPTANMSLRLGVRVRMSPGKAAATAGSVQLEYRAHAGDGHENQFVQGAVTSIPNDGAWHFVRMDVTVNGDTALAVPQIAFLTSDWYQLDGWTARDAAAGEGSDANGGADPTTAGYLAGTDFECYLDVANTQVIAAGLSSAAQASIGTYGRREAVIPNKNIVALNALAYSWVAAYLNTYAVPLGRTRVQLADQQAQQPMPGDASLIRVSGTSNDISDQYASRTEYRWTGLLGVSIELTTQRPTIDKLLKTIAQAQASAGGASATGATLAASSKTTPAQAGAAMAPQPQTDEFNGDGTTTTFTLTQTPISGSVRPHVGGARQRTTTTDGSLGWSVTGNALSFLTAPAAGTDIVIDYLYQPVLA